MYNQGYKQCEIAQELNISTSTVVKYLKKNNIYVRNYMTRLNDNEIQELCDLYVQDEWEKIFAKYPFLDKNRVRHITSKMKISKTSYFWTEEETNYLIDNFGLISYSEMEKYFNYRHSKKAISTKAIKLGLTASTDWSDEEINILKEKYPVVSKKEILQLLPKRSEASIVCKAVQLNVKSFAYLQSTYSDKEKQFILKNSKYMSDKEISKILNKPICGIQEQRRKLGIYHNNTDYSNYENIAKLFRGSIYSWKDQSMKQCNYKCILTGSSDFEIHHLYGFNRILAETFQKAETQGLLKSSEINDYSKEELEELIYMFKSIHASYPLGVCVEKNIHKLFHKIYGSGGNTEEQWQRFVINYKNNEYSNILKIA